jgi:phosphoribosylamine--glycine ligase
MRLNSDLLEGLTACVEGRLSETEFRWHPGASACVIAASAGYPGSYATGFPIYGLAEAAAIPGVQVFHAGTALLDGEYLTAGGRVLGVSAAGATLEAALGLAYEGIARVEFEGMYYRRDIGSRALRRTL